MLAEIRISGLGVIDEAAIELDPGFTVVTGETGAGKTMIVTGLHLLEGGRAEISRLRVGADRAVVEGRFRVPADSAAANIADGVGARLDDDGSLIAVRSVGADGRSRAHLGGRSAPLAVLSDLTDHLIAVHGQNNQLRLLSPAEQRAVLDRFAGPHVGKLKENYQRLRREWLASVDQLTSFTERSRELAREADLLRHGLAEISAVAPQPSEDIDLAAEVRRLSDVDQLSAVAQTVRAAINGEPDQLTDNSALAMLGEARRAVLTIEDPTLRGFAHRLAEVVDALAEIDSDAAAYLARLEADPHRLDKALSRQSELKRLTRKYGADLAGVLAWADDATRRLAELDISDEGIAALRTKRDALHNELGSQAAKLTAARQKAAGKLAKAVSAELSGLAMPHASIDVGVTPRLAETHDPHAIVVAGKTLHAGLSGVDDVELMLRTHQTAQPLPLRKSISGGELSRVMLALEVALANADPVPTMVFDEVDAGVGGRAAVEVGKRLAKLSRTHQVIVVTHLPQVAAFADRHIVVDKSITAKLDRSGVRTLRDDERVVELARMLAGLDHTDTGRAHAQELLNAAISHKRELFADVS